MDNIEKHIAVIFIIIAIALFGTVGVAIHAKQAEYRCLKDEIVTVVDKKI